MSVCSRPLFSLSATLSALVAVPLLAQTPDNNQPAPVPPAVSTRMWVDGQEVVPDQVFQMWTPRRGRLGVTINLRARESDSIGAFLESVTPNGPASRAGLRSGDVIIRLDGKSVNAGATGPEGRSLPGLKLLELAAKLTPTDTIAVEFRRGAERRTTRLITSDEPEMTVRIAGGGWPSAGGEPEEVVRPRFDQALPVRQRAGDLLRIMGPFRLPPDLADLELAPVNAGLGRYFGVTDGVLVIDVPAECRLNLQAGDVVMAVDGRPLTSPAHLLRILQSYESGEVIRLDIMRLKKKESIMGRIGPAGAATAPLPK